MPRFDDRPTTPIPRRPPEPPFPMPAMPPLGLIHALETRLRAWLKRRRLRRLLDYDDRRLNDLGFHREDLLWALRLPLSHDPIQALRRRHETGVRD